MRQRDSPCIVECPEQSIVGLNKLVDAFLEQLFRGFINVDSEAGERLQHAPGSFRVFREPDSRVTMGVKSLQGFERHRVDGIRTDQWFDLLDVAVSGILRARALVFRPNIRLHYLFCPFVRFWPGAAIHTSIGRLIS